MSPIGWKKTTRSQWESWMNVGGILPLQAQQELWVLDAWRPRIYTGSDVTGLTSHTPGWPEGGVGKEGNLAVLWGSGEPFYRRRWGGNLAVVWISFLNNELYVTWCTLLYSTYFSAFLLIPSFPNSMSILSSFPFFPLFFFHFAYNSRQLSSVHFICNSLLPPFRCFVLHKVPLPGFRFTVISGQCRTKPWPAASTLTLMPECRCRTNAADLWKKCWCSIHLLQAFRYPECSGAGLKKRTPDRRCWRHRLWCRYPAIAANPRPFFAYIIHIYASIYMPTFLHISSYFPFSKTVFIFFIVLRLIISFLSNKYFFVHGFLFFIFTYCI